MFDQKQYLKKWHDDHPNYQKELRQRNLEQIRERDRLHYQKNKEKIKKRNNKQWQTKKEKYNVQRRERYQKDKELILQRNKEYYQKNRSKILETNKEYHKNNSNKIKKWNSDFNKKWYRENKQRIQLIKKEYIKNNPEILLKSQLNYLTKLARKFSLTSHQYKLALSAWAKIIKKRDHVCVICGSTEKLNAHHIIHRAKNPELSFIQNNGLLLCKKHHDEVHEKNLNI